MESRANDGRRALIDGLAEFPEILGRVVGLVPEEMRRRRTSEDFFALVEHVWHLADLEEEGFAVRIERLLTESDPHLPDFRGDEIAISRRYLEQPLEPALERFVRIRRENRQRLMAVSGLDWSRRGTQELAGEVTLAEIPKLMLRHDREHAGQLIGLLAELNIEPAQDLVSFAQRME